MGGEQGGSPAAAAGELWGARANDWAELQGPMFRPLHEAVLRETVRTGIALLDAGCGAGAFCQMAAAAGAQVRGIDAAPALIAIARARTPSGEFRVGNIQDLPYPDDSVDLVTGFNSFDHAADPGSDLREARRVTRPAGTVVVATWGLPEECQATVAMRAVAWLVPSPAGRDATPCAHSTDILEARLTEAGLTPVESAKESCPWLYTDEETTLRGFLGGTPGEAHPRGRRGSGEGLPARRSGAVSDSHRGLQARKPVPLPYRNRDRKVITARQPPGPSGICPAPTPNCVLVQLPRAEYYLARLGSDVLCDGDPLATRV